MRKPELRPQRTDPDAEIARLLKTLLPRGPAPAPAPPAPPEFDIRGSRAK